ncbi:S-layer homology domain-containing protein [Peptoniphilus sp. BV3AC2]|uniref:S-layer homology domain-containing protein n=1 Tax=Peptoniphilus sp. BV3AC2 TaxID=1111133 RepID=UPI0003B7E5DE|nr:S-layer homology domain-containing protein [Peptoniphilus sp. BV3AC2]ERT63432.1 SLH domain protein [Peptoniphilus sp. BV3AC2]
MNNKKEKLNIISLHKKVALGLSIITMLGSAQPVFAFTPAKDTTKKEIIKKADEILKNKDVLKHLLGTNYLSDKNPTDYRPGIGLEDYEENDPKDSQILNEYTIESTPWYAIYSLASRIKEIANSVDEDTAQYLLNQLDDVLALYAISSDNSLQEDGDYSLKNNFKAVKVQFLSNGDGNQNKYQMTGEDIPEITDLLGEGELTKWGNELELLFVANKNKVSNIKSMLINKVAGKDIIASLESATNDVNQKRLIAIPIPAELNGSRLVVENMTYVDITGTEKRTGPFGIDINYKNLKKTNDNTKLYGEKTKRRIKYWIKRGEILLSSTLDADAPKDQERAAKIKESINKLQELRNSDKPSMTEALKYALPIYETENIFTLLEILNMKIAEARDSLDSGFYTSEKYTKESIDKYREYLDELERTAADKELVDIVSAIKKIETASNNGTLKYNTEKLEKLVKLAEKYDSKYYTDVTYGELLTAKGKANEWIERNKLSTPSIDETLTYLSELQKAIDGLQAKPGMTPPAINEENGNNKEKEEVYEVQVTDVSNANLRPLLDTKVKYYPKEKKFILGFKKVNNNFVCGVSFSDENFNPKKGEIISTDGKEDNQDIIKEVAIHGPSVFSNSIYISTKYYNASMMGVEDLNNIQISLDLNNKKLISGEAEEKEEFSKEPYEVSFECKNQNSNEKTYMEKYISPKAIYDPVNKKIKFLATPEMEGNMVKSYVKDIQSAIKGILDSIPNKKEEMTILNPQGNQEVGFVPKEFEIPFDIDKDEKIVVTADVYDSGSSKKDKMEHDSIWIYVKNSRRKTTKEELAEIKNLLKVRVDYLREDYNKVKGILPEKLLINKNIVRGNDEILTKDQKNNPTPQEEKTVNIKNTIEDLLNKVGTVDENTNIKAEDAKAKIKELSTYARAIEPWVDFKNALEFEDSISKYEATGKFTTESINEAKQILNNLKADKPMTLEEVNKARTEINRIYDKLRLSPAKLQGLVNDAEAKLKEKDKYSSNSLKALDETLNGYKEKELIYKGPNGIVKYKVYKSAKAFLTDMTKSPDLKKYKESNLKPFEGNFVEENSGLNLDIAIYDYWCGRLESDIKNLKAKSDEKVNRDELLAKIEEAEKLEKGKKSKLAFQELKDAIEDAKTKQFSENQTEINKAKDKLADAINKFKNSPEISVDELQAVISKAEKINKNKKSQENFQKLIDEINKAKGALKSESQETIDNAKNALEKAIKDFENSDDEIDASESDLRTVNIKLMNAKEEKESMAKDVLWNKAKLSKINGRDYVEMKFVPMMNFPNMPQRSAENRQQNLPRVFGAVTEVKYDDNGQMKLAEVIKSEKITVGTREVNSPTLVRIPVTEGQRDIKLNLRYYADLMGNGQGAGEHNPDARLRIDWNSIVEGFNKNEYNVDKGQLIELIESLNPTTSLEGISDALKNKMQEEINKAKAVEKNGASSQDDVKKAYENLAKAAEAIVIANNLIKTEIVQAEYNLKSDTESKKYTPESLKKVKELIENTKSALKVESDVEKIKELDKGIKNISDLLRYDMTELNNKISEAEEMIKNNKVKAEEKGSLQAAINEAKSYIKDHDSKGTRAGDKRAELTSKIDKLIAKSKKNEGEEVLDKSSLDKKLAEAKKIQKANKKQEAFDKLQKAISEIESSKDSINSKEALEAAIAKLDSAISEFNNSEDEVKLNKDALQEKIREAEGLSKEGKSEDAISNLEAAVNIAKAKMNAAITQEDITKALDDLNNAIESFNNSKAPEAKVEKAIYKVPVKFIRTNGENLPMGGDTLVETATLEVNGDVKKLRIKLQVSPTLDAYIEKLSVSKADDTEIGESVLSPEGNRPAEYLIDVSHKDTDSIENILVGIKVNKMPMKVEAYINADFANKTLVEGSQEESKPQIDKSQLRNLVAEIAGMDLGKYTQESKTNLLTALDAANQVLLDDNAKDTDVNRVLEQLKQAKNALVENKTNPQVEIANKDELRAKIKEAEAKNAQEFTEDSFNNLKTKLNEAKNILNKTDAKQAEVDTAKTNLENAINGLKKKQTPAPNQVDKSGLQDLISKANKISTIQYTDDSVVAFKEALKNANRINKDSNAKQDDVNAAKNRLELAMNNLKKKVNKVDLGNLIAECNRIKEDDFEYDFNMRVFKNALSDAKDVYNSSNSTQDQVDNALRNLSKAKSNLVAKKKGHILYEVPVSVQKPSGGESMANKVINPRATVEENNGRFTYTVQFGKLTIGDKTAGVDSLYIYDGGSKFAASRGANGTFSWTINSKVTSQRVSFKVSAMPSDQDAILMFSWGGAKETKNGAGKYLFGEAPHKKIELDKKDDENKKIEEKKNIKNKLNNPAQFRDTNGHWAKVAIDYVVNKGYFYGTSETSFSPNKPITRGQFVTVLGRMLNVNTSIYSAQNFNDVKSSMYYSSYIAWANKMGIVSGVGQGRFAPDKELTREEMAVIMSKFLKVSNKSLNAKGNSNGFKDDGKIESWAKEAVKEMAKLGVVNGMSDGKFAPKSPFTRAQVAQVLFNIDHN